MANDSRNGISTRKFPLILVAFYATLGAGSHVPFGEKHARLAIFRQIENSPLLANYQLVLNRRENNDEISNLSDFRVKKR